MQLLIKERAALYGAKQDLVAHIRSALTLPNPKYQDALKYGRWVGRIPKELKFYTLLSDGGLAFPRGWIQNCLELLQQNGIAAQITDRRRQLQPIQLAFQGVLRDYQQEAVEQALRWEFGVISAATGSGKTVIALAMIAERGQPCLVLVHNKELLHQWVDRIRSFLGIEPGMVGDGRHDLQPITVAIVNSARKHLDSLPQHFGHIVVDECHRTPATMFTETVQAFDSKYMLGLSATAYRRDGLTKLIYYTLGDRVHQVDSTELKRNGAVLVPEVIRRETSFAYAYRDDYQAMLSALVQDQDRNLQIAGDVVQQARSRSGTALVVSDRVQHCRALADLIERSGLQVKVLTGKCPRAERERIVAAAQEGEVDVLVSTVQLLGEGFDCSGLSSLFLATPIRFKGRLQQVVGRILRPLDGKAPVVFDYVDTGQPVLKAQAQSRARALQEVMA